jgi:hypothetical protein
MMVFLAAISFAIFFNMNNLPLSWHLNFKPFNCVPCLSVWCALVFLFIPDVMVEKIAIMFGAGVIAPIVYRLIHKL